MRALLWIVQYIFSHASKAMQRCDYVLIYDFYLSLTNKCSESIQALMNGFIIDYVAFLNVNRCKPNTKKTDFMEVPLNRFKPQKYLPLENILSSLNSRSRFSMFRVQRFQRLSQIKYIGDIVKNTQC